MVLKLTDDYIAGLDAEWGRLRSPGTWWTGSERIAIAQVARAARHGSAPPDVDLLPAAIEAATRLSADPHVTRDWVAGLQRAGLSVEAYVEVIGVVARLSAVDTFMFGIGAIEQPFPDSLPGEPTRELVPKATDYGAFVPTTGPPSPPNGLSAVTDEVNAVFDLHGVLYLSLPEMEDRGIIKDLTRAQMELVAARTSLLNDCFF